MTNDKQRERLVELLKNKSCFYNKCPSASCDKCEYIIINKHDAERITDNLLADGWMRPPCKVGETVWANRDCFDLPYTEHGKVIPCEVIAIKETKKGKYILLKPLLIETYGMRRVNAWFPFSAVGKTVFLTREEAEKALGGVQE